MKTPRFAVRKLALGSLGLTLGAVVGLAGCDKKGDDGAAVERRQESNKGIGDQAKKLRDKESRLVSDVAAKAAGTTDDRLAELEKRLADMQKQLAAATAGVKNAATSNQVATLEARITALTEELSQARTSASKDLESLKNQLRDLRVRIVSVEEKLRTKISEGSLGKTNGELIADAMRGHTRRYELHGDYQTLVIPVEFAPDASFDGTLKNREYYTSGKAQNELFGSAPTSLASFFKHESGGRFVVGGQVVDPVKVDKPLSFYGKSVQGANDEHARDLVVDALKKVVAKKGSDQKFWGKFDNWDLNDLDGDKNFHEPDGFVDAVVLVYAGKPQSSCQATFDPTGARPGVDDIKADDPLRPQKIECFSRMWPHRWSVVLGADSPDAPTTGPRVEGKVRSADGLRINESLHAFDYNMQSEFSDLSTFVHEFGHSLTLPDTYARSQENNVGEWDLMARNSTNDAQELSAYNKMALGWLNPKILEAGETTSAYLGRSNYVAKAQRESFKDYLGPFRVAQWLGGADRESDVLSLVPRYDEPVYRSVMLRTKPTHEIIKVIDFPAANGTYAAYSGRYDGTTRTMKFDLTVPTEGDATLSFDTAYHLETESNFATKDAEIKVVVDYDTGFVRVNSETKETFRLISGDDNYDTLAEKNPACEADAVLALRNKYVAGTITDDEKKTFDEKTKVCQAPVWVKKSYDLSALRGQKVAIEIGVTTDAGTNEFGLFVDNLRLGNGKTIDFENASAGLAPVGEFLVSKNGFDEKVSNQFYLFETRNPKAKWDGGEAFNRDVFQTRGGMAMFLPEGEGKTPLDRFRVVRTTYQPGVLAWHFDSRYDRTSNNPQVESQLGRGYILPVSGAIRELQLPGAYSDPALLDENGFYKTTSPEYKAALDAQVLEFKCFGYTKYATYLDGKAPNCDGYPQKDVLEGLTLNGRKLVFNRKSINEFLPGERREQFSVAAPFAAMRLQPSFRAGLLTFRAPEASAFGPIEVFKVGKGGALVLDEELTSKSKKYAPVSSFADKDFGVDAPHRKDPRIAAATATVEVKGVRFRIDTPDERITSQYQNSDPVANDAKFRGPIAKISFDWNPEGVAEGDALQVKSFVVQPRVGSEFVRGETCSLHGFHD